MFLGIHKYKIYFEFVVIVMCVMVGSSNYFLKNPWEYTLMWLRMNKVLLLLSRKNHNYVVPNFSKRK